MSWDHPRSVGDGVARHHHRNPATGPTAGGADPRSAACARQGPNSHALFAAEIQYLCEKICFVGCFGSGQQLLVATSRSFSIGTLRGLHYAISAFVRTADIVPRVPAGYAGAPESLAGKFRTFGSGSGGFAAPVSVRHFPISDFDMPETGSICDGDRFAELRIGCRGTFLAHYPEISLDLSFTDAPDWPIASQTLRRSYSTDWFLASGTTGEALRPGQRLRCSEIQARGQSFRQRGQLV